MLRTPPSTPAPTLPSAPFPSPARTPLLANLKLNIDLKVGGEKRGSSLLKTYGVDLQPHTHRPFHRHCLESLCRVSLGQNFNAVGQPVSPPTPHPPSAQPASQPGLRLKMACGRVCRVADGQLGRHRVQKLPPTPPPTRERAQATFLAHQNNVLFTSPE